MNENNDFVFGFVFGRKWLTSFVFVSVLAENKMTFSAENETGGENVILFSAETGAHRFRSVFSYKFC